MYARNVCIIAMRDGEDTKFLRYIRDTEKRHKG